MPPSAPLRAPGPPGHFLFGHLADFRRDVLALVVESAVEHGDVVRCRLGPHVVHLLNHPDHAAHVLQKNSANYDKRTRSSSMIRSVTGESLLTCNGEFWKRQRRMDQPAFHHRKIEGFAGMMTESTQAMLLRWQTGGSTPGVLDLASEMARLTYSIVGRTLFSFNTAEDAETIERAMRIILPHIFQRLGQPVQAPIWFPSPANRRFRRALADVDRVVYRIIASHRREAAGYNDLLALLMAARDPETGAALGDIQLRNETITFLLAGHETTANSLTWTFHLIANHPDIAAGVISEIDGVLKGRTPELEDLPKLVFTRHVIQESMRLYPPIWIIERRAIQADEISGFAIPKGSSVVISPYALHRHPDFWDRPEVFDPSRFEQKPPPAYLPFGAGPRFCIGNEFAMMEATIICAMVLQKFDVEPVPEHPVMPQPDITLRPAFGMKMQVRSREPSD